MRFMALCRSSVPTVSTTSLSSLSIPQAPLEAVPYVVDVFYSSSSNRSLVFCSTVIRSSFDLPGPPSSRFDGEFVELCIIFATIVVGTCICWPHCRLEVYDSELPTEPLLFVPTSIVARLPSRLTGPPVCNSLTFATLLELVLPKFTQKALAAPDS